MIKSAQYTTKIQFRDLNIVGFSLAGVSTSIAVDNLNICFDVGQGLPHSLSYEHYFITHAHMDHAAGIPYIISQKALNEEKSPKFYMPKVMVAPMTEIMNSWAKMEGFNYSFEFIGVDEYTEIEINAYYSVKPFKTIHRIPSFGYALYRKAKKLKTEFLDKTQQEIVELKKKNTQIHEEQKEVLVAFTGDTLFDVFQAEPWLYAVPLLITEVTYFDDRRPVARAREWGHIHFDEFISAIDKFNNEKIFFIHHSRRYKRDEIINILSEAVKEKLNHQIILF